MKLCKDCKHYVPDTRTWGSPELQSTYAICGLTSRVDGFDGDMCRTQRGMPLFGCGKRAKNFEARK